MVLQTGSVACRRADTERGKYVNQGELKHSVKGEKTILENGVLLGGFPVHLA